LPYISDFIKFYLVILLLVRYNYSFAADNKPLKILVADSQLENTKSESGNSVLIPLRHAAEILGFTVHRNSDFNKT